MKNPLPDDIEWDITDIGDHPDQKTTAFKLDEAGTYLASDTSRPQRFDENTVFVVNREEVRLMHTDLFVVAFRNQDGSMVDPGSIPVKKANLELPEGLKIGGFFSLANQD